MFFTDGRATGTPPEGEVEAIRQLMKNYELTCPIHTFGFGQY